MFMQRVLPILIAVPTALGLVGFAAWQRYVGPVGVPTWAFYVGAAVICVVPSLVRRLSGKTCCVPNS